MNYVENCYFDPNRAIYPVSLDNLRQQYPKTSFPKTVNEEFLAFLGLVKVVEVQKPENIPVTHYAVEGHPAKRGEEYYQNWLVMPLALNASELDARLEQARQTLYQKLSAYRYELEVGGITIDGIRVKTDRESQAQLAAALLTLNEGFAPSINWKTESGWVNLDKTKLQSISKIVAQHVQGCFNIEQMHFNNIQKLISAEDLANYNLLVGWPTTSY